jgi:Uma2 family endonuclease
MIHQLAAQTTTFDEFIAWLPATSEDRYELHDGEVIKMPKPRGKHSDIAGFIIAELNFIIRRSALPYSMPRECIVRSIDSRSGYEPDAIVLNRAELSNEPRWEQESILMLGSSIPLVVEVVSSNWQDDYLTKYAAYQDLGIAEYWIVDYLGLGGRRFIGSPKQPTISICRLVDGEYDVQMFTDLEKLQSGIFPELELTLSQLLSLQ